MAVTTSKIVSGYEDPSNPGEKGPVADFAEIAGDVPSGRAQAGTVEQRRAWRARLEVPSTSKSESGDALTSVQIPSVAAYESALDAQRTSDIPLEMIVTANISGTRGGNPYAHAAGDVLFVPPNSESIEERFNLGDHNNPNRLDLVVAPSPSALDVNNFPAAIEVNVTVEINKWVANVLRVQVLGSTSNFVFDSTMKVRTLRIPFTPQMQANARLAVIGRNPTYRVPLDVLILQNNVEQASSRFWLNVVDGIVGGLEQLTADLRQTAPPTWATASGAGVGIAISTSIVTDLSTLTFAPTATVPPGAAVGDEIYYYVSVPTNTNLSDWRLSLAGLAIDPGPGWGDSVGTVNDNTVYQRVYSVGDGSGGISSATARGAVITLQHHGPDNHTAYSGLLEGEALQQVRNLADSFIINDQDGTVAPTAANRDRVRYHDRKFYYNEPVHYTDPTATYRNLAASDLPAGYSVLGSGVFQVTPNLSGVANNAVWYSLPAGHWNRKITFGGRATAAYWNPNFGLRGVFANKSEADAHVRGVNDVVIFGGQARVVATYTPRQPDGFRWSLLFDTDYVLSQLPPGAVGQYLGWTGTTWAPVEIPQLATQDLTFAAALSMNVAQGYVGTVTLTGNTVFTITGGANGDVADLLVTQDTTGSRTLALATAVRRYSGQPPPALTGDGGAIDSLLFRRIAGNWYFVGQRRVV